MKTENEGFKTLFARNLGPRTDTPDFNVMWRKAAARKEGRILAWRMAASIALIAAASAVVLLTSHPVRDDNGIQITSWSEPTRILEPSRTALQMTTLTSWTSPTNFLLPENDQRPKKEQK